MVTEGRNKSGQFLPGHPDFVSGTGAKVGRPKTLKTEVREALQIAQDAMPQLILDMIRDAQDPNVAASVRQACREYLCDRVYGKANQPLSNKDGSRIANFTYVLPEGFTPSGLLKGEQN